MNQNPSEQTLFGHPKGLVVLFFTEMWERFSYYGMRGLFVLNLVADVQEGGFGWSQVEALSLYGTYTMMVYVMSIPGGILADKFIGQKKAVMIGGFLLVAGHGIMAIEGETPFYVAITLIILGVGALKPNISTMVGALYKKGDIRRDKGFTIFYMGINTGSALAALIVGYVGQKVGWHYGFGLAGIGMLLGQIQFIAGQKYLTGVGETYKETKSEPSENHLLKIKSQPLLIVLILFLEVLAIYVGININLLYAVLIGVAAPFITIGISIYRSELSRTEKDQVSVMLIVFLMVIAFWGAFEQAGGLMNLYAQQKTDRSIFGLVEMTAAQFQFFNPMFIIIFGIPVATFWAMRRIKGKEGSGLFIMAIGHVIMGLGFVMMVGATMQSANGEMASMWWLAGAYFLHTIGELCSSPVSLSLITKLAPVKYASIMMGLYFAMTGLGNKMAGLLGESATQWGEMQLFAGIGLFTVMLGLLVLLLLKKLKKLTHGAEDIIDV